VLKSEPSEQMDEIIRNYDKFESVKVIMGILCRELGIPEDSKGTQIAEALHKVTTNYHRSIAEWRMLQQGLNLSKKPVNNDIRQ